MKKLTLFAFSLIISYSSFSQSATYQALLALNHNESNNGFNTKIKPTVEDFSSKKSLIWSNVYFRYFKGNNIDNPQTAMKFSAVSEQTYHIYCEEAQPISINLNKEAADRVLEVSVVMFELDNGKIIATKLKNKSFTVTKEPKLINLLIDKENIKAGAYLKVSFEIESSNLKKLGPYNFAKPTNGNYDLIMTTNIPKPFSYKTPEDLLLKDQVSKKMRLKQFTNSTPAIADYDVDSDSIKWTLSDKNSKEITFNLESIFFGLNVGPSVKFLMEEK
ncbi:hypothetical protein EZ428_10410 [Pedobacter frigiditerrae]|uniref:Uncharacterized protein n=1 Tax=Pedobacter frigiditerrae TaxID=2530452 RepID=A0A4R0MXY6_9SPHI|nr:hypothetical protein [Pedobacter frigiditerrae]TCC92135.1 hypothetical protein EZ428_10410 [Pedobacter frigiditerrae]